MTRILLAVLLVALAAACNSPGATDPGDQEPDAEAFKAEMDAEAASLLPDLIKAFGGQLNGMQATFYERSGFGIWDYTAKGTVYGLPGTDDDALTAGAGVLTDHGFTVETDEEKKSLRARKGDVLVLVASAVSRRRRGCRIAQPHDDERRGDQRRRRLRRGRSRSGLSRLPDVTGDTAPGASARG